MKYKNLLLGLLLMASLPMMAARVNPETARKVATKSAKSGSAKGKTAGGMTKSYNKAAIKSWY